MKVLNSNFCGLIFYLEGAFNTSLYSDIWNSAVGNKIFRNRVNVFDLEAEPSNPVSVPVGRVPGSGRNRAF